MIAIERAADLQTLNYEKKGYKSIIVQGVPVEKLYCDFHRTPNDTALKINVLEPRLGDRVVNLTSDGVPFGLRGTVITIHNSTNYVEVKSRFIILFFFVASKVTWLHTTTYRRFYSTASLSAVKRCRDRVLSFEESFALGPV